MAATLSLGSLLLQLEEAKSWIFEQCFDLFTLPELQQALDAALAIEKDGGELIADGKRYRTPGGVFLRLLRVEHPEKMALILKEQTAQRRKVNTLKARRFVEGKAGHEELSCPAEVVGQIIGKGGMVINKFRRDFGCRITLNADKGTVRVEGPEGKARACRAQLQEEISKQVRNTHGDYYDKVLTSDFMCKKASTQEPWAALLHKWIIEAVEHTPASAMARLLRELVGQASTELVEEIAAKLEEKPDLLDSRKVSESVQSAIQAGPCTPDKKAGFDLQDLAAAGYVESLEQVWTAPDGERFNKAKFLEEVGDEELWLSELAAQADEAEAETEEASTEAPDAESPEKGDSDSPHATPEKNDSELSLPFDTPPKDSKPDEPSPKATLTMKSKKKNVLKTIPAVKGEEGVERPSTPPGNVLLLAEQFGGAVRRMTPPPCPASGAD